jgi:alkanesulfonate monooxygenase SsuD/methylene tetrahydromethanopterin reductase-like flavin-dependent oxidoreductase (luciferase family)
MALRAEQAGFDSIWLYDHLLYRFPGQPTLGIWECWSVLSALAEATGQVEIGTLVACDSFRNPAILAKMAATVDEVSEGRFTLGLGAGWNKPEFDAFGLAFEGRFDRFEESVQIIRPLMREGRVDFAGKHHRAVDCEIDPRGPRDDGPPLLIGSLVGPRMMRLAARYADIWNTAYLGAPDSFVEPLARLRGACEEVGRDPATLEVTATLALAFPDLGTPVPLTATSLCGSTQQLVEAFRLGTSHLMVHCSPYGATALERLAEAMAAYRRAAG